LEKTKIIKLATLLGIQVSHNGTNYICFDGKRSAERIRNKKEVKDDQNICENE
jgi:hypothetical protein